MRRLLAATAIATLALLSAGCGDDDDKLPVATSRRADDSDAGDDATDAPGADDADDADDTAAEPDDDADDTTAEPDDDATDETEADSDDGDDGDDGDAIPGDVSDADCRAASIAFATVASGTATDDIDGLIDQMTDNAPDEIADDLVMLAEIYRPIADAIKEKGGDVAAAYSDPEILALFQELSTPDVSAAVERVSSFFQEHCGLGS